MVQVGSHLCNLVGGGVWIALILWSGPMQIWSANLSYVIWVFGEHVKTSDTKFGNCRNCSCRGEGTLKSTTAQRKRKRERDGWTRISQHTSSSSSSVCMYVCRLRTLRLRTWVVWDVLWWFCLFSFLWTIIFYFSKKKKKKKKPV